MWGRVPIRTTEKPTDVAASRRGLVKQKWSNGVFVSGPCQWLFPDQRQLLFKASICWNIGKKIYFPRFFLVWFLIPYFLWLFQVNDVVLVDDGTSVKYAADSNFFTEKYEILWRLCFEIAWQSVRDFASYPSPSRLRQHKQTGEFLDFFFQLEERDRFRLPSVVCIKKAYKQFVFAVSDSIQFPLVHPFIHLSFIKKISNLKRWSLLSRPVNMIYLKSFFYVLYIFESVAALMVERISIPLFPSALFLCLFFVFDLVRDCSYRVLSLNSVHCWGAWHTVYQIKAVSFPSFLISYRAL